MSHNTNLLFAALRILACWCVVCIHFGNTVPCCALAVPIFMIMAFYFFDPMCYSERLVRRLFRIFIPMFFWGTAGFLGRCVVEHGFDIKMYVEQLLFGMPANSPLYFLNLILVNTLCIWLIFKLPHMQAYVISIICLVVSIVLQYTGWNCKIWKWLPLVGEITCGRFVELFPAALAGVLMKKNLHADCLWLRVGVGFGCVVTYCIFNVHVSGYGYQGIGLLLGAIGVCLIASIGDELHFRNGAATCLAFLSSLTAGIYYMHKLVGEMFRPLFVEHSIGFALYVFVVSAALVVVASRIKFLKVVVK